ncbi:cytochrome P450 [Thermasporomyces composti]|uniref:cytochrome P450 n=1 Tax=Thermasporomyces composti TaxID=696763 RepID=UPI000E2320EE|nr:cytochrome P450 [Thermasporomyces composti]
MERTAASRRRVRRPPGPSGVAVLGGLLLRRDPLTLIDHVVREHHRLAYVRLGSEHVYLLSHPDLVHELFVTRGRQLRKGRALERIRLLLGDGLLTSEGERHRAQRRLIQPALHGDRLATYLPVMVATARRYDRRWRDGSEIDMAREMSTLTLEVVGRALFGSDLTDIADPVASALGTLLDGSPRHLLPGIDLLLRVRTPAQARLMRAVDTLDRIVREVIARRRAAPAGTDLLATLLTQIDDDTLVRDEAMTLLLAGHETTATALTWTWWLLAKHPEVAAWLHEELDQVHLGHQGPDHTGCSGATDQQATNLATRAGPPAAVTRPGPSALLDRLPRTRAVLAEAMRLRPPSWILGRRTLCDVELDGWTLPAGSLCVASQWALHRDPRFWSEPESFQPQRWLTPDGHFDESAPGQPRAAYLPFGLGARICVGLAFAWTEGTLVLATLARRWAPTPVPGQVVTPRPAVTLRPSAMRMVLRART